MSLTRATVGRRPEPLISAASPAWPVSAPPGSGVERRGHHVNGTPARQRLVRIVCSVCTRLTAGEPVSLWVN